jgi:hypothetical protein
MKIKTIKRNYHKIALLLICFPLSLQAQQAKKDTLLTREMVLEKEYNPTIRDAFRLNTLPEISYPTVPETKLSYANYALPFKILPQLAILNADEHFTEVKESGKKGYLVAGIATNLNINGDLGYQLLQKENTWLNLFYTHRSANGKVTFLQENNQQRMKLNDNLGGIDFSHAFTPLTLSARLKYTNARMNYYGYGLPAQSIQMPHAELLADKTVYQQNDLLNIDFGVVSGEEKVLNYQFNLNIADFKQKYTLLQSQQGPEEFFLNTDWDAHIASGEMQFGVGGYFKAVFYSNVKERDPVTGDKYFTGYGNYGQLSLNPYIGYENGNYWKVRLGAKTHFYFSHGKVLSIAPDVALSIFPVDGTEIYLSADGGVTTHTNYTSFYENRYLSPFFRVADSKTLLDATFGVKSNIRDVCRFNVYAGYKMMENEHFFVHTSPLSGNTGNTFIATNSLTAAIMDANLFKIGLHMQYQYQDLFEMALKVQHNTWDVKKSATTIDKPEAWNKPAWEGELQAAYIFDILPLRLDLIYHLETDRKALKNNTETSSMKNIHELNAKANYTINNIFSVFAQANNLLFQRYDLWYGYPAQGFNILLGGSIKF